MPIWDHGPLQMPRRHPQSLFSDLRLSQHKLMYGIRFSQGKNTYFKSIIFAIIPIFYLVKVLLVVKTTIWDQWLLWINYVSFEWNWYDGTLWKPVTAHNIDFTDSQQVHGDNMPDIQQQLAMLENGAWISWSVESGGGAISTGSWTAMLYSIDQINIDF